MPRGIEAIYGLQEGDELIRAGYPEQVNGSVVVSRGGQWVATFSFVNIDGKGWTIEG